MTNTNAKIQRSSEGKLFIYTPDYDTVKARLETRWFQDDKICTLRFDNWILPGIYCRLF